jgi:hypothetical protein
MVIQYNKQDLDNLLLLEELRRTLNSEGRPDFEAVAVKGVGVFETLKQIIKMTLKNISTEQGIKLNIRMKDEGSEKKEVAPPREDIAMLVQEMNKSVSPASKIYQDSASEENIKKQVLSQPLKEDQSQLSKDEKPAETRFIPTSSYTEIKMEEEKNLQVKDKAPESIRMGYDKEIDDISPAASLYMSEITSLTKEQKELEEKAKMTSKIAPLKIKDTLPEKEISDTEREAIKTAKDLLLSKRIADNKIADEIKVVVSNSEVSIDQAGIRVPVKIVIPKSMQDVNLRFDLQVHLSDEEDNINNK